MPLDEQILGHGVYTPREAARLVGINAQQVLRWTRGSGASEPLWNAHFQFLDNEVTEISFFDLIEVRVVAAMRAAGVSLQAIRFAIDFAHEKFQISRPLASQAFKTDGQEILMSAVENDGEYVSLSKKHPGQKVFKDILAQSLSDLEYEGELVARWRPRNFPAIVIDPERHFGDPILDRYGISTGVLKAEYAIFKDPKYLSELYEIPLREVNLAIRFETKLDEADD